MTSRDLARLRFRGKDSLLEQSGLGQVGKRAKSKQSSKNKLWRLEVEHKPKCKLLLLLLLWVHKLTFEMKRRQNSRLANSERRGILRQLKKISSQVEFAKIYAKSRTK